MHPMNCRLYARFVMVERAAANSDRLNLTFLLPNMTFGESGLREHHALMTIARHFVNHNETTLPPTYRTMTDGDAEEAEDFIWDLKGWAVDFGASGGVKLRVQETKEIPDLAALEKAVSRDARLRSDADLMPSDNGIVRATVTVGGGEALARAAFPTPPAAFVPLSQPSKIVVELRNHTDIIDIVLPPADTHRVTLRRGETVKHITLQKGEDGENGEPGATPTVAFSNMCSALPHTVDIDFEFAQYYQIFQTVAPDRLVPRVSRTGGDKDCNRQARIRV
jgi:hypothetical protein